jgi:hypothetical protein
VPEDPDRDDFQLLAEAAEVGSDPTYQEKRKLLYLWQQEFVGSDDLTDAQSIRRAVEHMSDLVGDLKRRNGEAKNLEGSQKTLRVPKGGRESGGIHRTGWGNGAGRRHFRR